MGIVRKQAGAQSASYYVTADVDGETVITDFYLNKSHWALLPSGKLKDLLNRTYLKVVTPATVPATFEVDPAAFMAAYSAAGAFQVTSAYDSENVEDSQWSLAGEPVLPTDPPHGSPVLYVYGGNTGGTSARVSTSYSASE